MARSGTFCRHDPQARLEGKGFDDGKRQNVGAADSKQTTQKYEKDVQYFKRQ